MMGIRSNTRNISEYIYIPTHERELGDNRLGSGKGKESTFGFSSYSEKLTKSLKVSLCNAASHLK